MTGIYLVLAAGRGSRMGSPKALVEVEGETLLSHHVHAAQLARLNGPLCVTGAEAQAVEAAHADYPIRFLRNPDPASPMMTSVRLGLAAAPPGDVVFVTPVDVLPPRLDTFDLLVEGLEELPENRLGLRPVMQGRGGHPLVLLPPAVREILTDSSVTRLDTWVRKAVEERRVAEIEVDDDRVLGNFNHPEDLPRT